MIGRVCRDSVQWFSCFIWLISVCVCVSLVVYLCSVDVCVCVSLVVYLCWCGVCVCVIDNVFVFVWMCVGVCLGECIVYLCSCGGVVLCFYRPLCVCVLR